ncbi:LysR family transcriptional regulator [Vibrio cionasavignyae]|uniref:LysR family transcriptional regulator n=1 Tax=Vibrio cionasavignyae TaxID=2910252 RepID=UPI003D0D2907
MNMDQVQAFCVLAECKNYRLASERLFMTQSALTKKIQRLEAQIGSRLFERGRQGATLTLVGSTLLPDAKRLVANYEHFKELSISVAEGTCGYLNIGFGISTYSDAPKYIAGFKNQYPKVKIALNDIPSQTQQQLIESGALHLSFMRLPVALPLKSMTLFSDRLVVVVHEQENIDESNLWEMLSTLNYLQLNPSRGRGLNRQIERYLIHHDLHLEAEQEADDISTLIALVSARLGFAIVPASAQKISQTGIRTIPLIGELANWEVGVVWNGSSQNPLVDQLIKFITQSRGCDQYR